MFHLCFVRTIMLQLLLLCVDENKYLFLNVICLYPSPATRPSQIFRQPSYLNAEQLHQQARDVQLVDREEMFRHGYYSLPHTVLHILPLHALLLIFICTYSAINSGLSSECAQLTFQCCRYSILLYSVKTAYILVSQWSPC